MRINTRKNTAAKRRYTKAGYGEGNENWKCRTCAHYAVKNCIFWGFKVRPNDACTTRWKKREPAS